MNTKFFIGTAMLVLLISGFETYANPLIAGSRIHIVPLETPPLRVPTPVYGAWFGQIFR